MYRQTRPGRAFRMGNLVALAMLVTAILASSSCRKPATTNGDSKREGKRQVAAKENGDQDARGSIDEAASPADGRELYVRHCAACHGKEGDAQGIAAAYLFPKPRDFQAGRFRLVSTVNRTPSREDLRNVLKRGMPGSAMPPWDHLSDEELGLLVDEVRRLHREGVRRQFVRVLIEEEGLSEEAIQDPAVEDEIEDYVEQRTTPGEATVVPPITEPDAAAIARGKDIYMLQACNKCHGDEGRGDGQQQMVDDEGYPTKPRDFTRGIFKGGHDPASIYRRIAYGMPGTPMPSSQLTPAQIIDLSHFVLSLSDEATRQAALQKRRKLTAKRLPNLPADAMAQAWGEVEMVTMRMVPLWWRDDANPDIQVQAAHDGETLALRISWQDESHDAQAVTSSHFEDAVAVELYRGDKEPFLGMGGPQSPVDVWFWDADRQSGLSVDDQYPNAVVDIYPFHEKQVDTAEGDRPEAKDAAQPGISLPAVASGNPIAATGDNAGSGASSLTAGGPQTVTFRMPKNQAVDARGQWADGRWTVVMKRALEPPSSGGGVSLAPGDRASIALAVWNGARNDRNGQKLITIWNDLVLEE